MRLSVWPTSRTLWLPSGWMASARMSCVPTVSSNAPTSRVPSASCSVGCALVMPCTQKWRCEVQELTQRGMQ